MKTSNNVSCSCAFVTRWMSSLRPETSRWSEERDRRGRGAKRRLSRPLARREKVHCEHENSCTRVSDYSWQIVCISLFFICVLVICLLRAEETHACPRRGGPQSSEDDDQTESLLVDSGGLTDDALQRGLTPAQQQGTHTHTCSNVVLPNRHFIQPPSHSFHQPVSTVCDCFFVLKMIIRTFVCSHSLCCLMCCS